MSKVISFGKDATEKIVKGIDIACQAIGSTLGPKGLNAYLENSIQPIITNDGFSIAMKVVLKDKQEDAGAYMVRNLCSQQNEDVGDGTTTIAVLFQSIIHECLKRPENRMEIKESLKLAGEKVLKILSKKSVKIAKEDIEKVALISSENKEIAKYISEIIQKLGDKAVINVEDSKTLGTSYEIVDGFEIPFGYMSPYASLGKLTYTDVPVLVCESKISTPQPLSTLFQKLLEQGIKSCVIACSEIEDATLGVLGINKMKGVFDSVVIQLNSNELKAIAGATGATLVSQQAGVNFQKLALEHLGKAQKVVVDKNKTIVMGEKGAAEKYAEILSQELENEPNMYLQKKLEDRIARLNGGVAILRIGAPTDFERDYLRLKAEDAVKATQAAAEEGVVDGGGMCLWRIAQDLEPRTVGEEILKKALQTPFRKILENAGVDYTEIVEGITDSLGYNAKIGKHVNMSEDGLLDPAKVERLVVENAISAASTVITMHCLITEDETK